VTLLVASILVAFMAVVAAYLIGSMVRSIRNEKRRSGLRKTWPNFGLSIAFCLLFLSSWAAHGVAEWQIFVEEQHAHQEAVEVSAFLNQFAESTLENWQSEFLQLFSFVVLAALLIHRGSAESKDSDDRMEETLKRIERRLDELAPPR
jgi:uncharacterized protein DUF6766